MREATSRRATTLLIAAIVALLLIVFLYSIARILLLLFIAILFAIYLSTVTDALRRWLGVPRGVGLLCALVLTAAALVGAGFLVVPPAAQQMQEVLYALPGELEYWETRLLKLAEESPVAARLLAPLEEGDGFVAAVVQQVVGYFSGLGPYLFSGIEFVIHLVSILVMGVYLALRPSVYREGFVLLSPPVHRELVGDLLDELGATLRAWIAGQLFGMVVLGVLAWIGLSLVGVPYALAFGAFTAVVSIVPFFGTLVSTLAPAVFVLGDGGPVQALLVLGVGAAVQAVESNVTSPLIMQRQVRLPPVLALLGVLVMAQLLGLFGVFVAVPILASVIVVVRRIYVERLLEGRGFRRVLRDRPMDIELPRSDDVLVHPAAKELSVPGYLEGS